MDPISGPDFIASLPWYDLEEVRPATDAFWAALAGRLRDRGVPATLDRETPPDRQWASPRLLFSQACGYDLLLAHAAHLQVVATPRYGAPGCEGTAYRSFVVVRRDSPCRSVQDLRGARAAVNGRTSHSGMNAFRALVAPYLSRGRFFSEITFTGGHVRSLEHVTAGHVDVAAVDCVTYELLRRNRPAALEETRVLCTTPVCPAPPFVTSAARTPGEVDALRAALTETLRDPRLEDVRRTLLIEGADPLPVEAYRPIEELEREAIQSGCVEFPCVIPGTLPA